MATKGGAPVREAEHQGERVARTDSFEGLARAGLVARGVVYGIIGILALKLALGDGGEATNQQGALQTIAQGPFGKVLLALMAIGLLGYAVLAPDPRRARPRARGERRHEGPHRRRRQRHRIRGAVRHRAADPLRLRQQRRAEQQPGRDHGRRARLARGPGARRHRRARLHRGRARPGAQGPQEGVPRGLQDRGDELGGPQGLHGDRRDRATSPARSSSRSSAGSSSAPRSSTTRTRRSGWTARWPSWGRRRTGRSSSGSWPRASSASRRTRSPTAATGGSRQASGGPAGGRWRGRPG